MLTRLFLFVAVLFSSFAISGSADAGRWRHRRHHVPVVRHYRPAYRSVHSYHVRRPVVSVRHHHRVVPVVPVYRVQFAAPVVYSTYPY